MMKQEPISYRADNALAARCQSFESVLKRPIFYLAAYIDNNCFITMSKRLWSLEPQVSGYAVNFYNVVTKFIITNKNPKLSNAGNKWGKNRPWTKINEFYFKWYEHCQHLLSLFDWLLRNPIKSDWLKSWQFDSWKFKLKACMN